MNGNLTESASPSVKWRSARKIILILLVLYWCALFYGTHTVVPPGLLPGNSDKLIHFGSYAGLAILLMSLRATSGAYSWRSVTWRWLVLAAYGVFDELTQLLVNRHADVADWIADVVGVAAGLGLVNLAVPYFSCSTSRRRDRSSDESTRPN